jgi:glycosyltransferase involved in cell wall biosynthesis
VSPERVSVVIPARNAPHLNRTLESLALSPNRDLIDEVIVVGSGDYFEIDRPSLKFIPTTQPVTAPIARNIGIRASASKWVGFIDADCVAAPEWIEKLLIAAQRGYQVVGGGVAFGQTSYWAQAHNVSMLHEFCVFATPGPRNFFPTLNLLVHRDVIDRVGLMNKALRRAQDLEWTLRMRRQGITLWFEPSAVVTHNPQRENLKPLWRDYWETGHVSYHARAQADQAPFPHWFNSPLWLYLFSPGVAAAATLRIFARNKPLTRYILTAPGIWLTKLAWCLGYAHAMTQNDFSLTKKEELS